LDPWWLWYPRIRLYDIKIIRNQSWEKAGNRVSQTSFSLTGVQTS
jgi:hypothetical protein